MILQLAIIPQFLRPKIANPRIIKLPPASPRRILDQTDIMPTRHRAAQMPHHRIAVITIRPAHRHGRIERLLAVLAGDLGDVVGRRRRQHKRLEVKVGEGKVDGCVDFLCGGAVRGGEALEVDDKEVRGAGDGDAFGGFAVAFAGGTVPDFVAGEALFGAVGAEAVVEGDEVAVRWDFDADAVKGFPGCAGGAAGCALEAGNVLAGEEVGEFAVVAVEVAIPFFL